ncbi:TetR/AcrR family transcriptional regulator [Streptomyces sp. G45]|uniref:TetR/AcrR family transcriptional regulator n=1 Tax=Streptomyces sp. G45 TaxID=3406627 RepID=UPI003C2A102F
MVKAADRAKEPARASVWLEGRAPRGSGRKGDQPSGLDRQRITEATVRLLDAEGLAKFSMRRLAAELKVTAMSVYWYVDTKDDLLELALDAVCGEMDPPDTDVPPGPDEWQQRLRELAIGYRRLLVRHPWVSPLVGQFLNIGPNWLRFAQAVQQTLRASGLPGDRVSGAVSAVFQFVYGFGTTEGILVARSAAAGMTQEEFFRDAIGTVAQELPFNETIRTARELIDLRREPTVTEMWERDFAFALDVLIAGIEVVRSRA